MADNDQLNDEYQFSELDALGSDTTNQAEGEYDAAASKRVGAETNIRRNALIVVILVILAMIIYKFLGSFFSTPKVPVPKAKPAETAKVSQPKPSMPEIRPLKPVVSVPKPQASIPVNVEQKLSALELSQQGTRSEIVSVSNQLGGMSANMDELATQIAKLNDALVSITTKLEQQNREIKQLMVRAKPKKTRPIAKKSQPVNKYYIQAVIPGRAWLIAQNGATLTVREGTVISGYGTIKLIDPLQGRITTSSGQVIRFSQDDS